MPRSISVLRQRLEQLTCGGTVQVDAQPHLLEQLASELPHSIVAVPHLAPKLPIGRYNCFEFALGLAGRNEVRLISHFIPSTCCNGVFAEYLAASILVPMSSPGVDGGLVLYRDDEQFTHAGVVHGDRILSKWGTGHLWLHGPLEVPTSYGEILSYYRAVDADNVLARFLEFSRNREGETLVDEVLTFQLDANVAA